ncbi:MAG: hypothetical protein AAF722_18670 [Cyanobacteria bacterium P01_C01_bin.70]
MNSREVNPTQFLRGYSKFIYGTNIKTYPPPSGWGVTYFLLNIFPTGFLALIDEAQVAGCVQNGRSIGCAKNSIAEKFTVPTVVTDSFVTAGLP